MLEVVKLICSMNLSAKKHFYNNLNNQSKKQLKEYCKKSALLKEFYNFLINL